MKNNFKFWIHLASRAQVISTRLIPALIFCAGCDRVSVQPIAGDALTSPAGVASTGNSSSGTTSAGVPPSSPAASEPGVPTSGAPTSAPTGSSNVDSSNPVLPATSLTILNNGSKVGNALSLPYQNSGEGYPVGTYWNSAAPYELFQIKGVNATQYEIVDPLGGRCLSVNGNTVSIYSCENFSSQLFTFSVQQDNSYLIQAANGFCLAANESFAAVQALSCDGSANQTWTLNTSVVSSAPPSTNSAPSPSSLGSFVFLNEGSSSGNSLSLPYQNSVDGEVLGTFWDWQKDYEKFSILPVGDDLYEIIDISEKRCVSVNAGILSVYPCENFSNQLFALNPQTDNSYSIQTSNGDCLGTAGDFGEVIATTCDSSAHQKWQIKDDSGVGLVLTK